MIQRMLAIWSLVPLCFLNPAWTSGSSRSLVFCIKQVFINVGCLCAQWVQGWNPCCWKSFKGGNWWYSEKIIEPAVSVPGWELGILGWRSFPWTEEGLGGMDGIHCREDIGEGGKVAYALPQRAGEWKRVSVWPGMWMGGGRRQVECFLWMSSSHSGQFSPTPTPFSSLSLFPLLPSLCLELLLFSH